MYSVPTMYPEISLQTLFTLWQGGACPHFMEDSKSDRLTASN